MHLATPRKRGRSLVDDQTCHAPARARPPPPPPYNALLDMNATRPDRTPLVPPGGIDHQFADMTATFAADVTLKQAQTSLGARHYWLPIAGDEELSLGQLIEHNSTGPLRLGYGAWRDLLLGVQFRDGRGNLV